MSQMEEHAAAVLRDRLLAMRKESRMEKGKQVRFMWDRNEVVGTVVRMSIDGLKALVKFDIPGVHSAQTRKYVPVDELEEVAA